MPGRAITRYWCRAATRRGLGEARGWSCLRKSMSSVAGQSCNGSNCFVRHETLACAAGMEAAE